MNVTGVGHKLVPAKAPKHVVKKYDPGYIKFGSTKADSDAKPSTESCFIFYFLLRDNSVKFE